MPAAAKPQLAAGRVYRTRDLRRWGANPTRLARRLVREGSLRRLAPGLFYAPEETRFGSAAPDDHVLLRGFLGTADFVVTGPPAWNALGLGATAMFPLTLVYNTKRSGEIELGARRFLLRRVRYPRDPAPEWFAIDLIEHHGMAGLGLEMLEDRLGHAIRAGTLDAGRLRDLAGEYGTLATRTLVARSIARSHEP